MASQDTFHQKFKIKGGDFIKAGESSCEIRNILKGIGVDADIIRRVAIAAYEAEMNVVMYAQHGTIHFTVSPQEIAIIVEDRGQGIDDIERAMQPGYSTATEEMREMGFGAGMGLPNIKKNSDIFTIISKVGKGTKLEIVFKLNGSQ
jgi:anti-sigma regulatory factor (Ser/Thr protein kinase)